MSEHIQIPQSWRDDIEQIVRTLPAERTALDCAVLAAALGSGPRARLLGELIDSLHSDNRPTLLLHEGDAHRGVPTVWLLGWSREEATTPHDHGSSVGAAHVARGVVGDIVYVVPTDTRPRAGPQVTLGSVTREYLTGSTMTFPPAYTHDMYGISTDKTHRDITVHAYWPPLTEMGYFQATHSVLTLTPTRVWRKDEQAQRNEVPST